MAVVYAGGFNEDGVALGGATSKFGFFGGTPVAKKTITTVATTTSTTTLLEKRVARLEAALVAYGLVAFS